MTARRAELLALTLASLACAPDPADEPGTQVEPIGPLVYRVEPTWCPSECETLALYRDDATLQLLAESLDTGEVRETLATLADASRAELEAAHAALLDGSTALGELDGECLSFLDRPLVTLVVGEGVTLGYPSSCAPSGAAGLDARYAELLAALSDCAASPLLVECDAG
jgi:hypothetical protein